MTLTEKHIGAGVVALLIVALLYTWNQSPVLGSVETGEEYHATTTFAGHAKDERLLKTGQGQFGSVVITGDNTGFMQFYDATTSSVLARTGNKATSSILLADFPASSPETTYQFDAQFTDGLLMVTSGAEATSTVTWK